MTMITGDGVTRFQAAVLKSALQMYVSTGMKAGRAYTPSNMMATAEKITGKKFAKRNYRGAIAALDAYLIQGTE